MEKERSLERRKIINGITKITASLFFLLSLYYIIWSVIIKDDFTSVIIYSAAIALSIIAIEKIAYKKKSFILYFFIVVFLVIIELVGINVTSSFY